MTLHDIDPKTLQQWMKNDSVILVDVRENYEHASERIPGAVHIPTSQFDPKKVPTEPNKTVVFFCRAGARSARAAQKWAELGHDDCYHLAGGIDFWKMEGGEIEASKAPGLPIPRQLALIIGSLTAITAALGWFVSPLFLAATIFIGLGYAFSGITGFCFLETMLVKLQQRGD